VNAITEALLTLDLRKQEAVAKAALHLDAHIPGWAERIDADELDIPDYRHCIAAQVGHREFQDAGLSYASYYADDFSPFASRSAQPYWLKEIEARRA
jgi:hypothetical protein